VRCIVRYDHCVDRGMFYEERVEKCEEEMEALKTAL